jgi:hypothetical protein
VLNEQTIIQRGRKNDKADRMVVTKDKSFLLDYKTGLTMQNIKSN